MKIDEIVQLNETVAAAKLPYAKTALEPFLSKQTLNFHFDKHYKGYVKKLNELIKDTEFDNMHLEGIVRNSQGSIFNNAAQAWNHEFYWKSLSSEEVSPSQDLTEMFNDEFGGFDKFKIKFIEEATSLFGSGWVWLVKIDNKLSIISTEDADTPLTTDATPLMVCDIWEHAYYLDYQNDRERYVKEFLNFVDWSFVENNLQNHD